MHWEVIWRYREVLWNGLIFTLQLSVLSIVGSLVVGVVMGCLGALPNFFLRKFVATYVEVLRNLPVVVKLFFLYFVVGLEAMPAAVIALVTHQSAYIADLVAAGLRAVPREQSEAAYACGHGQWQIYRHILLPQALRIVAPPMTSQFIEVVKNTSTAMLIGVEELTFQTQAIESETFRGFEAASTVTLMYLAMALAIAGGMGLLERRLRLR
ncbi:MAG: polar amino acid transporter inner rane subunit [Rubritepida sp.]|nr:polar amino acid transporter inner rane subunit [Rubritepida sp.]